MINDIHFIELCVSTYRQMQHMILTYMQISNEKSARDAYHLKNTA